MNLFQKKSLEKSQKVEENKTLEKNKKSEESIEKITARTEKKGISEKETSNLKEIPVNQPQSDSSDNQKYILLAVMIVLLVIIRIFMNNWF